MEAKDPVVSANRNPPAVVFCPRHAWPLTPRVFSIRCTSRTTLPQRDPPAGWGSSFSLQNGHRCPVRRRLSSAPTVAVVGVTLLLGPKSSRMTATVWFDFDAMRHRSVESPHYHIWTDALHARQLAREANNDWDRGTYVRWALSSAWTAFEGACEDALATQRLGNAFRRHLDRAFGQQGLPPLDWSKGLWYDVSRIYALRKDYVHPGTDQRRLFPPPSEADDAIRVLRAAIRDVYAQAGKGCHGGPTTMPIRPILVVLEQRCRCFKLVPMGRMPSRSGMWSLDRSMSRSDAPPEPTPSLSWTSCSTSSTSRRATFAPTGAAS